MQAGAEISGEVITVLSFAASIASLILAGLAIWLSLYHKKETDRVNDAARDALAEIRSETKVLSKIVMPELREYGRAMREQVTNNRFSENTFRIKPPSDMQLELPREEEPEQAGPSR